MRQPRLTILKVVIISSCLLPALLFWRSSTAQESEVVLATYSTEALFQQATAYYNSDDWLNAVIFLQAYINRKPPALQQPKYSLKIYQALTWAMDKELGKCGRLPSRVAGFGLVVEPPVLEPFMPEAPAFSTPTTVPSTAHEAVADPIAAAAIPTQHRTQAYTLLDTLLARTDEFQANGLTPQKMAAALQRPDVGDRLNALVQEIWSDWLDATGKNKVDPATGDPGILGFSPFRQLVIRFVQGRQGTLSAAQQMALYDYFTRNEAMETWRNGIDGVIGAINKKFFPR